MRTTSALRPPSITVKRPLSVKTLKKTNRPNITIKTYKGNSQIIEKYIYGSLVKARDELYNNPNLKPTKNDTVSKEKEQNFKANKILEIIKNGTHCPKEIQDLHITIFFITKGGGYQYWGNFQHFISASFGEDTVIIILN